MANLAGITVRYDDGSEVEIDLDEFDSLYWTDEALEMLRPYYVEKGRDLDDALRGCRKAYPCCHSRTCFFVKPLPPRGKHQQGE